MAFEAKIAANVRFGVWQEFSVLRTVMTGLWVMRSYNEMQKTNYRDFFLCQMRHRLIECITQFIKLVFESLWVMQTAETCTFVIWLHYRQLVR